MCLAAPWRHTRPSALSALTLERVVGAAHKDAGIHDVHALPSQLLGAGLQGGMHVHHSHGMFQLGINK